MENENVIRTEMEETREKLSEKLDTLEQKLAESVEEAKQVVSSVNETVHDSVANVKESVNDTVATVKESVHETVDSVKDFMDIEKQWEQHPWLLAGGAVACGYVLAIATAPAARYTRRSEANVAAPYQSPVPANVRPQRPETATTAKTANASLLSAFAPELNMLKSLALGATFSTIRELIATQVPPAVAPTIRAMVDGLTKKLGAEPITPTATERPSTDSTASAPPSPNVCDHPTVGVAETNTRRW
jgi:ElaB/YqjD/DUF883 family membrane-anchored ribosome-binding protein